MCLGPLIRHLEEKKEMYEKSGMSKEQIRKHVGTGELKLIDLYHKNDHENRGIIEESKARVRVKYELTHHQCWIACPSLFVHLVKHIRLLCS
ncbi:hypothetical protein PENTCL1PPCAC_24336, partial [Pristionchus entomophagus]